MWPENEKKKMGLSVWSNSLATMSKKSLNNGFENKKWKIVNTQNGGTL